MLMFAINLQFTVFIENKKGHFGILIMDQRFLERCFEKKHTAKWNFKEKIQEVFITPILEQLLPDSKYIFSIQNVE